MCNKVCYIHVYINRKIDYTTQIRLTPNCFVMRDVLITAREDL